MSDLDITYLNDLASEADADMRCELARQVSEFLICEDNDPDEIRALIPLALKLADDVVLMVRMGLAAPLYHAPNAPREVVIAQIADVDEISSRYLRFSQVLTDSDLADIAKIADMPRLEAIIARSEIGPLTTHALIEGAPRPICGELLAHAAAEFDDAAYSALFKKHGRSARIRALMLDRADLPMQLRTHLIVILSDRLRNETAQRQWLSEPRAEEVTISAQERALLRLASGLKDAELANLITTLQQSSKLTGGVILRSACAGNLRFVAYALSHLAGVPLARVQGFMQIKSGFGLGGICKRAGLPAPAFKVITVAISVYQELADEGIKVDESRFGQRMVERILTRFEKLSTTEQTALLDLLVRYGPPQPARLAEKVIDQLAQAA